MGEAVLYFPYINVPRSEWLVRALLYWDEVGTIVPSGYARGNRFDEWTRSLLVNELLCIADPTEAMSVLPDGWGSYMSSLDDEELMERRTRFAAGRWTRLSVDKLTWSSAYHTVVELGLGDSTDHSYRDIDGKWVNVEVSTATEFMAAMAYAISHPRSWFSRRNAAHRWIPATDETTSMMSLVGAATRIPVTDAERHDSRVRRADRSQAVLAVVLKDLFPVPAGEVPSPDQIAEFKQSFGSLLPAFRSRVREGVHNILSADDYDDAGALLDEFATDLASDVEAATEALQEAGFRRVVRSSVVELAAKLDPTGVVEKAQKVAQAAFGSPSALTSLAYAAFANVSLFGVGPGISTVPVRIPPRDQLVAHLGANA